MKTIVFVIPLTLLVATVAMAQAPGWVGVTISEGQEEGVLVGSVEADSPASQAGIQAGDVITEFDGTRVVGVRQFTRIVTETPVGRTVQVTLERDGRRETIEITIEDRPSRLERLQFEVPEDFYGLGERIRSSIPDVRVVTSVSRLGMHIDSMTPQLREFFGAAEDTGVLISSVEEDSPAADAGLRAGDVIVAFDGRTVDSPRDLGRIGRVQDDEVTLTVLRDRSERDVAVALPANTR